ncbi:LPS assembly protein LptD [Aestuariibacter halophilus]|uniref:LPS-assembly protein LptD n=1 Tax=Fluctibacter halophilus TaxID=226011 RepID=A0ABS8GB36_9ALTE|nr:LPS assembly protein LptD [Aestuariibacter halophilus]MCC2617812.1 LPS assembly protein LptD [Aestuariibacter halophilus]
MRQSLAFTLLLSAVSLPASAVVGECLAPLAPFEPFDSANPRQIKVQANRAEIQQDTVAQFKGNVDILSNDSHIQADEARIDKVAQQLQARGKVSYRDAAILVNSNDVSLDMASGQFNMLNSDYRLSVFNGRGAAEQILLDTETGIALEDVSFTTCPEGGEDWKIVASSITLEKGKVWGEARNTRFYLGGVPVFYLPYFAFPISDQRQTGLLIPEFDTSSSTGLSYEQAFYWNMAPNYDATIAPRLMANRGTQLKGEFRYLVGQHFGQLNLEYLGNDRGLGSNDDRYFYRYVHSGKLSENWQISADINGLSDDNYLVDLGSDYYNRADTHLYQTVGVNYYSDNLDFHMAFRDFEVLGNHPSTYRALPEMKLFYQDNPFGDVEFRVHSELAYFDNRQADAPRATRFHIAPSLAFPYRNQWGEFLAEASLLSTHYRQQNVEGTGLSRRVERNLGQAKLYGAINFERQTEWFSRTVTQTLEPKIQYLYTSYEDQTDIGLYDTTRLLNDFSGLFRGQEFTGLDRISDNNQLTLGVTSRILDKNNREQFKLSLGQIFYLDDNRVQAASKSDNRSALAAELDWRLGSKWFAHADVQVSTANDNVERSSMSLEYQHDDDKIVQLNHRFVRDLSGERIEQLGLTASWPLSRNWRWVGRWYKDIDLQRTIESYTGVQYESCCWSLALVVQRNLINRFDITGVQSTNEFESSISLRFSFNGLGNGARNTRKLLEDGLFGYRQPYLLN